MGGGGRAAARRRLRRGRLRRLPGHPLQPLRRRGGAAGGAGTRGRSGGGRPVRAPSAARDLEAEVAISFEQAIAGAQIPLSVPTTQPCPTCRGTGAKPGTSPKVCPKCQGRGIESQGQGLFSISQPCSRCGGSGAIIEDPCPTCHGAGSSRRSRTTSVNIPAGVREGSRVRLAGKGEPGRNGGPPGDLYVVTHVAPSPIFERKGDNVEVEVPLTIPEAIRGAEVEVPTLNGRKKLRVPPGTKHGTVQRLRGEGPRSSAARAAATSTTASSSTCPATLSAEQSEAVDKLVAGHERRPASEAVLRERCRPTTPHDASRRIVDDRGVFMISVAAELAEMHPQTLRMYEQRGLIEPKRSPKGTRLYSHEDVERLRRIQEMTNELGLNLAGVERVLELEQQLDRARRRVDALERRTEELQAEMVAQIDAVKREMRGGELVPLKHTRRPPAAPDAAGRARAFPLPPHPDPARRRAAGAVRPLLDVR